MRREVRHGMAALPRRPLLVFAAWSVVQALPTMVFGLAVARSVDAGFLAGRPLVGLAWLGGLLAAAFIVFCGVHFMAESADILMGN